jgi:hypothetical protein
VHVSKRFSSRPLASYGVRQIDGIAAALPPCRLKTTYSSPVWLPLTRAMAMSFSSLVSQNVVPGESGRMKKMQMPQAEQIAPIMRNS